MYVRSKAPTPTTQATTTSAPPPVDLVAATAQPGVDSLSQLAPSATASATSHAVMPPIPMGTSAINTPPIPTVATTSTGGAAGSYSQLAMQMSKTFQAGDGKGCLAAYDQMKGLPEFDANTWSMMHGYCLMEAGQCDAGRRSVRDYYAKPNANPMLATSPQQVDTMVSSLAQTYCPPSQLQPPERAQRAQTLIYRSSGDKAAAARYADELAQQIPSLPRGSEDERRKISGYEYAIGKAYGDAGRCGEAKTHFRSQCSINSPTNVDNCANGLLNGTSCKGTP
jgi:hypothetical protein